MALDVEVLHLERLATLKNVVALLLGVTSETVMAELLLGWLRCGFDMGARLGKTSGFNSAWCDLLVVISGLPVRGVKMSFLLSSS